MRKTQKRVPVVLDVKEVLTLIDRLTGTHQTAAKLQYGSGLRLNELVSLRIQDADPKRSTVTVRGGKGDRDRVYPPKSVFYYIWEEVVTIFQVGWYFHLKGLAMVRL